MPVTPGARTALARFWARLIFCRWPSVTLFGPTDARLPKWFREADWGVKIDYHRTSFLPPNLGSVDVEAGGFPLKISSAPRAVMECLHLASGGDDLVEARELMDGLNNLGPMIVQTLLEACTSIKVKRLFLYLADAAGHDWVRHIDRSGIDLGSGARSLVSKGTYIPEYKIMVPRELVPDAKPRL
ncbi:type IV toxin-antitoxin system AbiEi family antitoxin domain-containing protein [Allomesorhizobium camelthorni]|uniref:type IV toxin-antitoxin system AbiEi family antitoxin domain-containing protein n=1 Tax=Allomesorhizobium camelthorni TaxID=475069 RepID=UPI0024839DB0|nr:type IV toxin-antitoxin system AbiEi family antitoxin domain-containing protein [Mesorhizobium camelthorni]